MTAEPELFEAQTQVFGFPPVNFIDRLIEAWTTLFYDTEAALRQLLEEQLLTQDPQAASTPDKATELLIEEGMQKWATRFEQGFDKCLGRWEMYMQRNLLKPDAAQSATPMSSTIIDQTEEEAQRDLDTLRTKMTTVLRAQHAIQADIARQDRSLRAYDIFDQAIADFEWPELEDMADVAQQATQAALQTQDSKAQHRRQLLLQSLMENRGAQGLVDASKRPALKANPSQLNQIKTWQEAIKKPLF